MKLFVGEDTACVSWRFAGTSPNILSAKPVWSPNLVSAPPKLSLPLKVSCVRGLLCSWPNGPPPSANRSPGNRWVWPKPPCFTRFTNPQWVVMRKAQTHTHQGPCVSKDCSYRYTKTLHTLYTYTQTHFGAFGVLLTKKLKTTKPFYLSLQVNPLPGFSLFGESFPCLCLLYSGRAMKPLPIYPFLLGRHSAKSNHFHGKITYVSAASALPSFCWSEHCKVSFSNAVPLSKFGLKFDRVKKPHHIWKMK